MGGPLVKGLSLEVASERELNMGIRTDRELKSLNFV